MKQKLTFRIIFHGVFSFLLLFSLGCSTFRTAPLAKDQSDKIKLQDMKPSEAYQYYARILKEHVDEKGWVHFRKLAAKPGDLHTFVSWIALVGPKTKPQFFTSREEQLAYYTNSYNALSMFNVIESDFPKSLSGLKKVKFFALTSFMIDGEKMSPYSYENNVIRKMGEERLHFALNCSSGGCPRLPREPFIAGKLEKQLDTETRFFFSEERNLRVDDQNKTVHVSEILDFYTEDFIAKNPTLIDYINRYRSKKIPADYKVKFIPYDWTVVNLDPAP